MSAISSESASQNSPSLGEETFPACNVYSFLFSNPFSSRREGAAGTGAKYPPTPPHKPVFFDPRTLATITHSRLRRDTLRLAHGVHKKFGTPRTTDAFGAGSIAGPVVLVHLPNSIIWPVLVLGFLAAGWTVTGTNPGYTVTEMTHIVTQCEPSVVICHPGAGGESVVRAACANAKHSKAEILLVDPEDDVYGAQRNRPLKNSWTTLLSDSELQVAPLSSHDANRRIAFIIWTSGTTGKSKGALMSHRAVVAGITQIWDATPEYTTDERWIAVAPFYHVFGLYNQMLIAPCIGATILVLQKFNLEDYLRLASAFRATVLHIAPPIAVALAKSDIINQPWCQLDSVAAANSGGAPIAPEIILQVWNRLKFPIKLGYGLSEMAGVTATAGISWEAIKPQVGSAGRMLLGIEAIFIEEDGKSAPRGSPGEIILRSPAQMLGYLKNPQATAEAMDERGFHTGDVGYLDDQGNLHIIDRLKELIKYKAFQVSPTELEGVITTLPEVLDVAVSSVYSDAQGTELPLAFIVPRDPALHRLLAERTSSLELVALAEKVKVVVEAHCIHYKRLRGGVTFLPAIPKSPSGKILRRILKDQAGVHVDCYAAGESRL